MPIENVGSSTHGNLQLDQMSQLEPELWACAQVHAADLYAIAAKGFRTVINARPGQESPDQVDLNSINKGQVVMSKADSEGDDKHSSETRQSLTFFQMVVSILASFVGIQSSKRRDRDFELGKPIAFLMVGTLMTVVWYGAIALIVHFVVP